MRPVSRVSVLPPAKQNLAGQIAKTKSLLAAKGVGPGVINMIDRVLGAELAQHAGILTYFHPELIDYFLLRSQEAGRRTIAVRLTADFDVAVVKKELIEGLGGKATACPTFRDLDHLLRPAAERGPLSIALYVEKGAAKEEEVHNFCSWARSYLDGTGKFQVGLFVPLTEKRAYEAARSPHGHFLGQLENRLLGLAGL
jgi:hypothetical protein